MSDKELDFYQQLRVKFTEWAKTKEGKTNKYAEWLMAAPDFFHLMCKLTMDKRVTAGDKAKLAIAIVYFISPLDLLPEALIGPIGYLDDLAMAAWVLHAIVNNGYPEVVKEHWAGDGDVLAKISQIIEMADDMIGSKRWKKIIKLFE